MSHSHKLRTTAGVVTAFYSISNSNARQAAEPKRKRKRSTEQHVSLEMIKNMSTNYVSPFQLASDGNLEELKSFAETFSSILKEQDENHATTLHHAASTNQIAIMQYLIESGIELNSIDKDGHTALHVATLQEHVEATGLLLNNGIDDKILNNDGNAGLHIAARSNNTSLVAAYLEHCHIDIVVPGHRKRTPLHVLAEHDNLEACEVFHNSILVQDAFKKKVGFRLCATDEDDLTPIHLAARKGSHRVLDFFMTKCKLHGYPPEVILGFLDEENSTPLHAAIDGGHVKVVEVLLKHGANPVVTKDSQVPPFLLACSQGRLEVIDIMVNHGQSYEIISCRDMYGQTCLHRCTQSINSHQIISYLVDRGAEVNAVDNKGQTPLMISIVAGSAQGVSTLLDRGADVLIKDVEGNNVMHHAVTRKRKKILGLLLQVPKAEELVMSLNNKSESPIHYALRLGLSEMVNAMVAVIKHKLKNIKDCSGNNYLHLAAQGGNWKAIAILLEIPECLMLLNEVNKCGGTPLHVAAYFGHLRCVELFLSHGAMIHKCHFGSTPFMSACTKGHAEVAHILFEAHPFQLNWTNDNGDNSLHLGAKSGCPQVITLLLDIGVPIVHNNKQESFFDLIILKNDLKCAAAVIQHSRYQEALDLVSHKHPMINLIVYMPEIAKQVLDRSHTKCDLAHQNPDYWEKYDFKYLRLSDEDKPQEEKETNKSEPQPISMDDKDMMQMHTIKYKGSVKRSELQRRTTTTKCLSHLQVLKTMVKFNRGILLTHPISDAFIKNKWRNYGKWIHIMLVFLVFMQVLFLLLFTALIPRPTSVLNSLELTNDSMPCGNGINGTIECLEFSYGANICRFIALALAILNFIIWLLIVIKIRQEALNLIHNTYIYIDLLSVVFTVYYLIPSRGLNNAYWSAGAIAAFFSWFSLVLRIQLFDVFGIYITMFLTITRTVFQVLIICFLFVIAFAISLYILAGNLTQYSNIGYALFVNFGHLLGELDYEAFVKEDVNGNLEFDWLTFMFVSLLAILMGIVIMNLLIGLAVGDIEQIRSDAIAGKKLVEVSFFSQTDSIIPSKILSKLDKPSYTNYPNKSVSLFRQFWRVFWRYLKGKNPSLADTGVNPTLEVGVERKNKDLQTIKRKVDELTLKQEKIMEVLTQMRELQDSMLKIMSAKKEEEEDELCPL